MVSADQCPESFELFLLSSVPESLSLLLTLHVFRSSLMICSLGKMENQGMGNACPSTFIIHVEPLCILKELIWKSHGPDLFFCSHRRKNPVQK